jgi:integrase
LNTGKSIEPNFWDADHRKVKRAHPDAKMINEYVHSLKVKLEGIIDNAVLSKQDPTVQFVVEKFNTDVLNDAPKRNGLFQIFDQFIEKNKVRVSAGLITDYNALKRHLMQFEAHCGTKLTFSNIIKAATYDEFIDYMRTHSKNANGGKGLKPNSVGKQVKNLKVFLKYCMRLEVIPFTDLSIMKKQSEKTFNVYLNDAELQRLFEFDLSQKPQMEIIRDLFIIGSETGLRFSDYSRLSKHHLNGDFIRISTLKTHDMNVIPISPRLRAVLNKYEDPGVFQLTNQYFNREIKEIMKLAGFSDLVSIPIRKGLKTIEITRPKWEMVSSHTCRRSFCTNQVLKGVPTLLIRKISGHKTEKAFLEYIKVDEELAAEEMLKYWA